MKFPLKLRKYFFSLVCQFGFTWRSMREYLKVVLLIVLLKRFIMDLNA
jgi:hypothetical protein